MRDSHACARFKYIPACDDAGVILRRRAAIKPRRAEFTVTGSNSRFLSLSLAELPSLSFLVTLVLGAESYGALWSESWDRGLAGSHDRWGLTPLVWSEPMVPAARGTALFLFLLLVPLRSIFPFLYSSPSIPFLLPFIYI